MMLTTTNITINQSPFHNFNCRHAKTSTIIISTIISTISSVQKNTKQNKNDRPCMSVCLRKVTNTQHIIANT